MKFIIKDFFSKCDQIRIWSHLLMKSLTENFHFCAVLWYTKAKSFLSQKTKDSMETVYKN